MKLETRARQLPEHTNKPLKERNVTMANAIARSAQGLNLSQKRIIALALAKTDSMPAQHLIQGQQNGWLIRITAVDYAETYEVDQTTAYEQLKLGAKTLLRTLWTKIETQRNRTTITQGQWLSLAKYHEGIAIVDIVFHPMIAPYLLGLRKEFVTYKLKHVVALRSIYAWRLFECLKSWETTGQWKVTVQDFTNIIEAPASYKKNFGQLRRWALDPAVQELQEKQNLLIEYELERAGRKILAITFRFRPNPQTQLTL